MKESEQLTRQAIRESDDRHLRDAEATRKAMQESEQLTRRAMQESEQRTCEATTEAMQESEQRTCEAVQKAMQESEKDMHDSVAEAVKADKDMFLQCPSMCPSHTKALRVGICLIKVTKICSFNAPLCVPHIPRCLG